MLGLSLALDAKQREDEHYTYVAYSKLSPGKSEMAIEKKPVVLFYLKNMNIYRSYGRSYGNLERMIHQHLDPEYKCRYVKDVHLCKICMWYDSGPSLSMGAYGSRFVCVCVCVCTRSSIYIVHLRRKSKVFLDSLWHLEGF